MKLTKAEFKQLIKESLKELIQEGVIPGAGNSPGKMLHQQPVATSSRPTANDLGGLPQMAPVQQEIARLNNRASAMAQGLGAGDPARAKLYEAILADTAQTSAIQTMLHETNGYTPEQAQVDQKQLKSFGDEAPSRWAQLAFATPSKSKLHQE